MRNGFLPASSGSAGNSETELRKRTVRATHAAAAAICETMERRVLLSVTPAISNVVPATGPAITAESVAISATEGALFNGTVTTFGDIFSDPAADYTASVDWGDGTTTAGTVTGSSGSYTVAGSHMYSQPGSDPVTVIITNTADDLTGTASGTATVAEGKTVLSGTGTVSFSPTEGGFSGGVATFSDIGSTDPASDFTADIQWGDGTTTAGTVSGSSGDYTVSGSHSYADDGTVTVVVTLFETGLASGAATASSGITVADDLTLTPTGTAISATEQTSFDGTVANFGESNGNESTSDFTATISWGDGSTSSGTVQQGVGLLGVSGDHTYTEPGTFTVVATLSENSPGTASATATSTATVADDLTLTPTQIAISATEGSLFDGNVASFGVSNTNESTGDFTSTISWGDGTTTSGTTAAGPGSINVAGEHTYADEGKYTVVATLSEDSPGTASATATSTATVADADNLAGLVAADFPATAGVSTGNVAIGIFSDTGYPTNPTTDFSAEIFWGDGSSSAGTITGGSGILKVNGSHTYAEQGTYHPEVTIADDSPGTSNATVTAIVTVSPGEATPTLSTTREPAAGTVGATFADKATISGGDSPTGNVTFDLFNNSQGSGTFLFTSTEALSGGTATSKGFIIPSAGTDYWVVTYGGDSNNNKVTSNAASEPVVVSKAVPTFSNLTSPTILIHASSVTLGGHIGAGSLVPAGSVSITLNGVTKSASIGSSGNFSAAFSTASLPVEPYTVKYAFAGNSNYGPASASSMLNVIYGIHYTVTPNPPTAHGPPTDQVHIVLVDANGANVIAPANAAITATGYALAATPSKVKALPADNPNPKFSRFVGEDHFDYTLALPGVAAGQYVLFFTITGDPTLHQLTFTVA